MRELKFRAWGKDIKKFLYIELAPNAQIKDSEWRYNGYDDWEQYTNLKDKNGKEIYEGDIIDFFGEKYPVIYRAGCFWAEYSKTQKDHLFLYATDSEVIGNIHENPELVKEKE